MVDLQTVTRKVIWLQYPLLMIENLPAKITSYEQAITIIERARKPLVNVIGYDKEQRAYLMKCLNPRCHRTFYGPTRRRKYCNHPEPDGSACRQYWKRLCKRAESYVFWYECIIVIILLSCILCPRECHGNSLTEN